MSLSRFQLALLSLLVLHTLKDASGAPVTAELLNQAKTGDLLFMNLECGEVCEAIEDVTLEQFQVNSPRLSHVGILIVEPEQDVYLLEAWPQENSPEGIRRTPAKEFLSRVKDSSQITLAKILSTFIPIGTTAAKIAESYLKKPYDSRFVWGDENFYCSEFIYEIFKKANNEEDVFAPSPMYFGKKDSEVYKVWEKYFLNLEAPIPEGQLGISPLGIYLQGIQRFFIVETN